MDLTLFMVIHTMYSDIPSQNWILAPLELGP